MPKIIIVGLGPAEDGLLTVKALETLKKARFLCLRTSRHPTVAFLEKERIEYHSFDQIYEESEDFEEVYSKITKSLIDLTREHKIITYAVPGHPLVGEKTTFKLLDECKDVGIEVEIIPGLTFLDSLYSALLIDPLNGLQILDGLEISRQSFSPGLDLIVTQVYSRLVASDVKLHLLHHYPSDHPVRIVKSAGSDGGEFILSLPLEELDHYREFDHLTSLYLSSAPSSRKSNFENLLEIMTKLRSPSGCPWDREQTHDSLKRHLIEESYEVVEAIDKDDFKHLMEELGDLLLQIVFHAQIAAEEEEFTIYDVLENLTSKLVRRHPHIFGGEEAETAEDVMVHWDKAKKAEGKARLLMGIPGSLPALLYAYKVQKKAARVGFDWEAKTDVLEKLSEEVEELKEACTTEANHEALEDEIGDILFTVVNVARHFDIEAEDALRKMLKKFKRRFEYIEEVAEKRGLQLAEMPLGEKDKLWQKAKELEIDR